MIFPANTLFGRFFPWHNAQVVQQIAGEVARGCQIDLWQRVCHRTATMSVAEIRGYVSAYAVGVVEDEVDQAFYRRGLKANLRSRAIDAAINQLTVMVVHEVLGVASPADTTMMAA